MSINFHFHVNRFDKCMDTHTCSYFTFCSSRFYFHSLPCWIIRNLPSLLFLRYLLIGFCHRDCCFSKKKTRCLNDRKWKKYITATFIELSNVLPVTVPRWLPKLALNCDNCFDFLLIDQYKIHSLSSALIKVVWRMSFLTICIFTFVN